MSGCVRDCLVFVYLYPKSCLESAPCQEPRHHSYCVVQLSASFTEATFSLRNARTAACASMGHTLLFCCRLSDKGITHWTLPAKSCAKRDAVPFGFLCHETYGFFGFFLYITRQTGSACILLCSYTLYTRAVLWRALLPHFGSASK